MQQRFRQRVAPTPDVLSQEVAGEIVLLDLDSERYFGLDEVGCRIWQLLQDTADLQEIFEILADEYQIDEATLRRDLEALVAELAAEGLVTLSDDP